MYEEPSQAFAPDFLILIANIDDSIQERNNRKMGPIDVVWMLEQ